MSKNKTTLAQLLSSSDNELHSYDAAQVAVKSGLILEAQLENGGAWYVVQNIAHKNGRLQVRAGGIWCKPFRIVFYRSAVDYNTTVRQRSTDV